MGTEFDASFVESLLRDPFAFTDEDLLASSSSEEEEEEDPVDEDLEGLVTNARDYIADVPDRAFQDTFHVCKSVYSTVVGLYDRGLGYAGCVKVPPGEAAAIVLRYLRGVDGFGAIGREFGVSARCARNVIATGVRTLAESAGEYVTWPTLERQFEASRSFYEVSRIEGAVASIEVSHFEIEPSVERWSEYMNDSNYPSIVMQGIVSFDCKFIDVFLSEGSDDPYAVLEKSCVDLDDLGEHFLVGNHQSYGRRGSIVTPFPDGERPTWQHDSFNKNLEIVYTRSLKAFGYLKGRFPRLGGSLDGDVRFASDCVRAGCVLHNLCADVEECKYFVKDAGVPAAQTSGAGVADGRELRDRVFRRFVRACAN